MTAIDIFLDRIESNGIVVGTNHAGDIPLGTVFTELVKIQRELDPSGGESTSTELWSKSISLRLVGAIIFRKSIQVIPRGWSAGMRLEGQGTDEIADALEEKKKAEFIHLRVGKKT